LSELSMGWAEAVSKLRIAPATTLAERSPSGRGAVGRVSQKAGTLAPWWVGAVDERERPVHPHHRQRVVRESVVSDVQELAGTLAAMTRAGRRRLTFEEVLAAGQPAVYRQFGDHLLYIGGRLFEVRKTGSPIELEMILPRKEREALAAHRAASVGIEYGWHHAADCPCSYCTTSREAA
jgi:hypothetical protein